LNATKKGLLRWGLALLSNKKRVQGNVSALRPLVEGLFSLSEPQKASIREISSQKHAHARFSPSRWYRHEHPETETSRLVGCGIGEPNAVSNAIDYAKFRVRSQSGCFFAFIDKARQRD
jgi:hypothetical protein